MKTVTMIVLAALLPACTSLVGYAPAVFPSLEYCDNVVYVRKGNQVDVQARCLLPTK